MKISDENIKLIKELEQPVSVEQVRPWIRYWARTIDLLIFLFPFMGIIIIILINVDNLEDVLKQIDKTPETLFGVLIGFMYIFIEPIFLSTWGTTIGKSLLKVSVRNADGSKLSYVEGLKRTFSIWFSGQGLNLPLVTLITHIFAYNELKAKGITSWDKDGDYIVFHEKIGILRAMVAILIPISIMILYIVFLNAMS